jgi:hypothetical protein
MIAWWGERALETETGVKLETRNWSVDRGLHLFGLINQNRVEKC